ncbi:MAG: DNA replication and repair protein RecF [Bacteroidales bacterium]|nr:DNA replication and repair protein RecF [Bacteroidales bacterium]
MIIERISIVNFKNIAEAELAFSPAINCVVGANGMGKSNLLEAVYYLSMTRSFLRLPDAEVIRHSAPSMLVKADYQLDSGGSEQVSIGFDPSRRKVLRKGGKEYKRMSSHIGSIPLVLASPADAFLITGSPEERRRLMDAAISQADAAYLQHLLIYSRAVTQRNASLKAGITDPLLFEGVEAQIAASGAAIIEARTRFAETMTEPFERYYAGVAGTDEQPALSYQPSREAHALAAALAESRMRDSIIGHTTVGPHRDDLALTLAGRDLRRLGSQGQMKTFTIALRLALHQWLRQCTGVTPLLLLDDIFDKLDASRVGNILNLINEEQLGQTFITDTGREHIDALLRATPSPYLLLEAAEGKYSVIASNP